jgi:hypothetical protein
MNYTFGGVPEAEACHWNEKTFQEFGHIVFLLSGSKVEDRRKGYYNFYEFKRRFMENEFNEKMIELEVFRLEHRAKGIYDLLEEIGEQIIEKQMLSAEESRVDISSFVEITDRITKNTPSPEELEKNHNFFDPSKAEQLSLF